MEDTGHYHVALLKFLLSNGYPVALINPKTTDLTRKMEGGITKNDKLDTITICDVLDTPERKKQYRITKVDRFDLYEQRQLTRHHHNLKEELNVYCNRLQKSIDLVFPKSNHKEWIGKFRVLIHSLQSQSQPHKRHPNQSIILYKLKQESFPRLNKSQMKGSTIIRL
ncbi:MAG: transposase [Holdemanella sp.]